MRHPLYVVIARDEHGDSHLVEAFEREDGSTHAVLSDARRPGSLATTWKAAQALESACEDSDELADYTISIEDVDGADRAMDEDLMRDEVLGW